MFGLVATAVNIMTPYNGNFKMLAICIKDVTKSPNLTWENPIALPA